MRLIYVFINILILYPLAAMRERKRQEKGTGYFSAAEK